MDHNAYEYELSTEVLWFESKLILCPLKANEHIAPFKPIKFKKMHWIFIIYVHSKGFFLVFVQSALRKLFFYLKTLRTAKFGLKSVGPRRLITWANPISHVQSVYKKNVTCGDIASSSSLIVDWK